MNVKLSTEHHLGFLSLKGGCTDSWVYTCEKSTLLEITCHGSNTVATVVCWIHDYGLVHIIYYLVHLCFYSDWLVLCEDCIWLVLWVVFEPGRDAAYIIVYIHFYPKFIWFIKLPSDPFMQINICEQRS